MCPYQAFEAKDGPFLLAITNDAQWQRFCRVAGWPELGADERYRTNAQRVENYAEVAGIVGGILKQRTGAEWLAVLSQAKVPASPIQTIAEVLEHPHTRARDIVGEFAGNGPNRKSIAIPMVLDGRQRSVGQPPPEHGADTGSILRALGYGFEEIETLFERGIVEGKP
jgi:crotonobetainyl-CoA:carnitine CoA-transferase CaiB-like acyl-CoA transferase